MNVFFDNAATTPIHPEVIKRMTEVLADIYGNPSSIHAFGRKAKSVLEQSRRTIAKAINAAPSDIFFTSCATESINMILKNAVRDLGIERIISSPTEHHAVTHTLDYLSRYKACEVIYLNVDSYGAPDIQQLKELLQDNSKKTLVSLMHGNNEIGTMSDLQYIGSLCAEYGVLFHSDTVQTMGKYPINVKDMGVHFLVGSAHKFHGPKGVGFAYIHAAHRIGPMILGGAQERGLRSGTENIAGIVAMARALEIAIQNMDINTVKITALRQSFKEQLMKAIPHVHFNGNQDNLFMPHVLSVSFPPHPNGDMLMMNLDLAGIAVSSGSACSSGAETGSHVLAAIGQSHDHKTIRFSFSSWNTEEEVQYVVAKIKELVKSN